MKPSDLIEAPQWRSRGYLPHFDAQPIVQTVTFRLIDTLPRHVVEAWKLEIEAQRAIAPRRLDPDRALRLRIEQYLDTGPGQCWLGQPPIAQVVEDTLLHFDGIRYRMLAWVIMPNHVHSVLECQPGWPLRGLVRSWKLFSARRINTLLGRSGPLWFPDYYDRFVRDEGHLAAAVEYVHQNPVKAGLVAEAGVWRWSSAWRG